MQQFRYLFLAVALATHCFNYLLDPLFQTYGFAFGSPFFKAYCLTFFQADGFTFFKAYCFTFFKTLFQSFGFAFVSGGVQ